MTREDYITLAKEKFRGLDYPEPDEIADFALEGVRRHNEECAKIVEGDDKENYYQDSLRRFLSMKIREAKP